LRRMDALPDQNETESRVAWAVSKCRENGLRRTKAMEELLRTLVGEGRPMTLAELAASGALADQCDKATVYRLLVRLEGQGIIRRLGLHERSAYFMFLFPGEHQDFLICTDCGKIEEIGMRCPVGALEQEVTEKFGYRGIYHELEFFGRCPGCCVA
jgi:Fur family ferric uptake transcriptional regulator